MLKNSAKANFAVEELGWAVYPLGKMAEWDGLSKIFIQLLRLDPTSENSFIKGWKNALMKTYPQVNF